jgi:beta-phosphoglucomutase-like phosphatase (HAD superfamily)
MKIKAVLFDCDGLMLDTERVSQDMWRRIGRDYGIEIPDEVFVAITGVKDDHLLQPFYEKIPHLKDVRNDARKKRFDLDFWSSFYPDGITKKGLVKLNYYLHEEGIACGVCSSSNKTYVETLLRTSSVPLYFDTIIGGDMVTHGKPDPEIFLKGAEVLGVEPSQCLVLEDSKMGILAARNAGMHSCFIEDTIHPDEEMLQAIEYRKDDLGQVIDLLENEL